MSSIAIIPSRANRIRALRAANPKTDTREIARQLGMKVRTIDVALSKGDTRRIKSTAK